MTLVVDSLLDVPLDEPGEDGDDRWVPSAEGVEYEPEPGPRFVLALVGEPATLVVPYRGPFRPGRQATAAKARAVIAMKRSLAHADCYAWEPNFGRKFNGYFGKRARAGLEKFTRLAPGIDPTDEYTPLAHAKLARYYDPYSIEHLLDDPISPEMKKRQAFLAQLMYLYNRRWNVAYSQARPFDLRKPPARLDCSSSGEWAARWSGIRSPSGYSSYGYGNTDTQISFLRNRGGTRPSIREAEIGDPKMYGVGSDPSHVAWFIGRKDGVSRVWSNGHYPLGIYDADYRHDGIGVFDLLA